MVSERNGWLTFQIILAALVLILGLTRLFDDEIAGWFAEDRNNLTPVVTIDTPLSRWDIETCVDDTKVWGLALPHASDRTTREFLWTDENGVVREVVSFTNSARDTRLDIVDRLDYRQVDFFAPDGREMREGEKAHLLECLKLERFPLS